MESYDLLIYILQVFFSSIGYDYAMVLLNTWRDIM